MLFAARQKLQLRFLQDWLSTHRFTSLLATHLLCARCGVPFLRVSAPEIVSGMSGESEAKIRHLFQEAASLAPCIVFIGAAEAGRSVQAGRQLHLPGEGGMDDGMAHPLEGRPERNLCMRLTLPPCLPPSPSATQTRSTPLPPSATQIGRAHV